MLRHKIIKFLSWHHREIWPSNSKVKAGSPLQAALSNIYCTQGYINPFHVCICWGKKRNQILVLSKANATLSFTDAYSRCSVITVKNLRVNLFLCKPFISVSEHHKDFWFHEQFIMAICGDMKSIKYLHY